MAQIWSMVGSSITEACITTDPVSVPLSAFAARKARKGLSKNACKTPMVNVSRTLDQENQLRRPEKRKPEVAPPSQTLSLREPDTTPATDASGFVVANGPSENVSSLPSTTSSSVDASAPEHGELYVGGSEVGGSGGSRQAIFPYVPRLEF